MLEVTLAIAKTSQNVRPANALSSLSLSFRFVPRLCRLPAVSTRDVALRKVDQALRSTSRTRFLLIRISRNRDSPNEIKTVSRQIDGRAKFFSTASAEPQVGLEQLECSTTTMVKMLSCPAIAGRIIPYGPHGVGDSPWSAYEYISVDLSPVHCHSLPPSFSLPTFLLLLPPLSFRHRQWSVPIPDDPTSISPSITVVSICIPPRDFHFSASVICRVDGLGSARRGKCELKRRLNGETVQTTEMVSPSWRARARSEFSDFFDRDPSYRNPLTAVTRKPPVPSGS